MRRGARGAFRWSAPLKRGPRWACGEQVGAAAAIKYCGQRGASRLQGAAHGSLAPQRARRASRATLALSTAGGRSEQNPRARAHGSTFEQAIQESLLRSVLRAVRTTRKGLRQGA
jgi:hypothetical protein